MVFVATFCEQQGNMYVWGGEFKSFTAPTLSFPEHTFSDIFHSVELVAKKPNGTLYFLTDRLTPVPYSETDSKFMCTVIAGSSSSVYVVINEQGDLYAWGYQPGDGSSGTTKQPVKIQGLLQGKVVTQCTASAGGSISVLTSDNKMYSWGNGNSGQVRVRRYLELINTILLISS